MLSSFPAKLKKTHPDVSVLLSVHLGDHGFEASRDGSMSGSKKAFNLS